MAIDFPNSPTNGQTTTVGNMTYVYNSTVGAWEILSSGGIGTLTTKGDLLSRSTTGLQRVAVGTEYYYLSSDSSASAGMSWRTSPLVVANSAARPASPYQGQTIYQLDTNRLLIWNGSAWVMPNQTTSNPNSLELVATGTATTADFILNNCFSSTYDNYRIILNNFTSLGVRTIALQLTSSSSPPSSSYYWGGYYSTWGGGFGAANSGSGGLVYFTVITASNGSPSASQIEVQRPFIADRTTIQWVSTNYDAGYSGGGYQSASSSFDGFRITNTVYNDTNSFNYWVYGYRKAL